MLNGKAPKLSLGAVRWDCCCGKKKGGDEDIETRRLKFQQPPSLAVQFFRTLPPSPIGFEVYKFSQPPPNFFQSPPFACLKIFGPPPPPSISSSPLVILNELSLSDLFKTGDGI